MEHRRDLSRHWEIAHYRQASRDQMTPFKTSRRLPHHISLFLSLYILSPLFPLGVAQSCTAKPVWLTLSDCEIPGAATVHSWGAKIGATSNATNQFCVAPSTNLNDTFLFEAAICSGPTPSETPQQCRSRRGNVIDRSQLSLVDVGRLGNNDGWASFQKDVGAFQFAAETELSLKDARFTTVIGLVSQSVNSNQGQLGLAWNSSIIQALKEAGSIGARSWGLNSGSTSKLRRTGSLVLGGYDQNSPATDWVDVPIDYPELLGDRHCPLQVKIKEAIMKIQKGSVVTQSSLKDPPSFVLPTCIEPLDLLPRFPGILYDSFLNALQAQTGINLTVSDRINLDPKLNILEPGFSFPSSVNNFNLSLVITLTNGLSIEIPDHEMKRPLRGLAGDGSVVTRDDFTEIAVFKDRTVSDAASLGRTYLAQVYLFVDQEKKAFRLAVQNPEAGIPNPTPSPCLPTPEPTTQPKPGKLSPGAIAGIVIGSVLGLAIVIAVAHRYYRKWRANRHWADQMDQPNAGDPAAGADGGTELQENAHSPREEVAGELSGR